MAAETAMSERSNDELRHLRRGLRKLRRKQEKRTKRSTHGKTPLTSSRPSYTDFRSENRSKESRESRKERKSWEGKSGESKDGKPRRSSHRGSKDVSKELSRIPRLPSTDMFDDLAERLADTQPAAPRRRSKQRYVDNPEHQPTNQAPRGQAVDEAEKASLKISTLRRLDALEKTSKTATGSGHNRSHHNPDVSEEQSLKPSTHRSSHSSSRRSSRNSSHKKHNLRSVDDDEERSLQQPTPRRHSYHQESNSFKKKHLNSFETQSKSEEFSVATSFADDASVSTVDTNWGERYFQLQSQYTAEEALEMLKEEQEAMKEMEKEKEELQRDMEEAQQQRQKLRKALSKRHVTDEEISMLDDDASVATFDSTCRSIVSSIFNRNASSVASGDQNPPEPRFNANLRTSVTKWCANAFPDLQEEARKDLEEKKLKMKRDLEEARMQRDQLSRRLAVRTQANAKLLAEVEKMDGITSYDDESLPSLESKQESHWADDRSVGSMASHSTARSFVSAIFQRRTPFSGSPKDVEHLTRSTERDSFTKRVQRPGLERLSSTERHSLTRRTMTAASPPKVEEVDFDEMSTTSHVANGVRRARYPTAAYSA